MERYEAGYCRICVEVFDLSSGEDGAPEAGGIVTESADSSLKMGTHHDGLCGGITQMC